MSWGLFFSCIHTFLVVSAKVLRIQVGRTKCGAHTSEQLILKVEVHAGCSAQRQRKLN